MRSFAGWGLAILLVPAAAQAGSFAFDPNDPPQGRFSEDWMEVYMGESKVGFGHSLLARNGDHVHTEATFTLVLGRAEQPVRIEFAQRSTERINGTPESFESEMNAAVMKTSMIGRIANGRVTITTSQYGMEQQQDHAFPTGALMTWGLLRESMLRGFEPGTEYTLSVYAPELRLDGAAEATTRIGPRESKKFAGRTISGRRMTVTMTTPIGSTEMVSWVDPSGRPLLARIAMPGLGDMVMATVDQKTALEDFVPPEVFTTTTIPIHRSIDRRNVKRIRYRVHSKAGAASKPLSLPDTEMQKVKPLADGALEVVVERLSYKPARRTSPLQASPIDPAEYLEPNLMINTKDPRLIELARQASSVESNRFVVADRLRRFVSGYVQHKNLNVGFATASEVCRTREGDCSEHGVLLAALGRLHGLPSRVVVGLAYVPYFGRQENIFGYHLWTQFWIDGRWLDYDAALGESDCSPARIAFMTSSLQNAGLADLSLPLLDKIGAIGIDILEIE